MRFVISLSIGLSYFSPILGLLNNHSQPLTPYNLTTIPKNSGWSVSPNHQRSVYSSSTYDPETNESKSSYFLLDHESGESYSLHDLSGGTFRNPVWLGDNAVAFIALRGNSTGPEELVAIEITDSNNISPLRRLLRFHHNQVDNLVYHRGSQRLFYTAKHDLPGPFKDQNSFSNAMAFEQLYARHWDKWYDYKVSHLHSMQLDFNFSGQLRFTGPYDLMKDLPNQSTPLEPFGDVHDFTISPDGEYVSFLTRPDSKQNAWHTTIELYQVKWDGSQSPQKINQKNLGAASNPCYTSDGENIAYLQMDSVINESDYNNIILYNLKTKKHKTLLKKRWIYSPSNLHCGAKSNILFFEIDYQFKHLIYFVDTDDRSHPIRITHKHSSSILSVGRHDLVYLQSSSTSPPELFNLSLLSYQPTQISNVSEKHLAPYHFSEPEVFWFKGAKREWVQGVIYKPIDFDPKRKTKYPVAFWIHGGPESPWSDSWSWRWNYQIPVSAGYVVIAINFHGSPGYGQKFTKSILKNWGSHPYMDLMTGLDFALDSYKFIDSNRMCAWGASYGGYMINWINGHTERFNCLINHDGMFDARHAYYTTDELYFNESEFGAPPFKNMKYVKKYSPSNFVYRWRTPTLVVHGGRDYRLVDGEGLATFTALQRRGIPSKLLYFPDENHWVLKPANYLRWANEHLKWVNHYTNPNNIPDDFVSNQKYIPVDPEKDEDPSADFHEDHYIGKATSSKQKHFGN